jgi:uncharacterized membrane protein YccC
VGSLKAGGRAAVSAAEPTEGAEDAGEQRGLARVAKGTMRAARSATSAVRKSRWLVDSVRTAIAAAIALGLAELLGFPEAYWAPISTLMGD